MIKTLIIDKDEDNREELLWHLKFFGGFDVVAVLTRFEDLEEMPDDTELDAAFVSLELPTSDGFYCSYYLQKHYPDAHIVMMSESKDAAYEAFAYGLFDYILKPMDPNRVEKTIARLKDAAHAEEAIIESPKRIMVKLRGRYQMIGLSEILYLEMRTKKCYMVLQDGTEVLLQRYTMEQQENLFAPFGFYRCYQSIIVQISKIAQLYADADDRSCTIALQGSRTKLPVSRDKFQQVIALLQESSGITVTGNDKSG